MQYVINGAIELDPNDQDFQNNFKIIMTDYLLKS